MSSFAQGFGFGFLRSTFGGFGFGFGCFGFGGFGLRSAGVDPIFTCYADLDSRSGLSSWMPGLNYSLNSGFTTPLRMNTNCGLFSFWC